MSTALVTIPNSAPVPPTTSGMQSRTHAARPALVRAVLEEEKEQRDIFAEYVRGSMVEGVDYGTIPGTDRKTLLKPGAEKTFDLFRCSAEYKLDKCIEVFADPNSPTVRPFFFYRFRCLVVSRDTGGVVAEGFGSGSSHESKYRYRYVDRTCPACGAATIKRSKRKPEGWYCFGRIGGCGANFQDGTAQAAQIAGQKTGKEENPDVADQANTILKMAKKRAAVDAALALGRCSDMFTQDVEEAEEVKADKPQPPKIDPAKSDAIRDKFRPLIEGAKTGEELKETWGRFNAESKGKILAAAVKELTGLKDQRKAALAEEAKKATEEQPANVKNTGGSKSMRSAIIDNMRNLGEELELYGTDLDGWLSGNIHDGLTFEEFTKNEQEWNGNLVAQAYGQLRGWMQEADQSGDYEGGEGGQLDADGAY